MTIPLYIPTFNNPTYTRNFISQALKWNFLEIIILDNNSNFEPMISFLDKVESKDKLIRFKENLGPNFILRDPDYYKSISNIFTLSDPDVESPKILDYNFLKEMIDLIKKNKVRKVGFARDIPKEEEFFELIVNLVGELRNMLEWEQQFWKIEIDRTSGNGPVYLTTLDTQFAVYNKDYFIPEDRNRAIRIGPQYTSKHLSFYKNSIVIREKADSYRSLSEHAYYIGSFDENGVSFIRVPLHTYYLLTERLEGAERELRRVTFERDKYLTELNGFYQSKSWKFISLLRKIKNYLRFSK
jgi:hypothetical protein